MRPRRIQNKALVHPLQKNTHDYNEDTYNAIEDTYGGEWFNKILGDDGDQEEPTTDICLGPAHQRRDCGYRNKTDMENHLKNGGYEKFWIPRNPEECEERGCCFDDSIPGVNWCFKKRGKEKTLQKLRILNSSSHVQGPSIVESSP